MKKTVRTFTFSVPAGTQPSIIRTFMRDASGVDHPVEKEIEVPVFEQKTLVARFVDGVDKKGLSINDATEQWALAQFPAGTLALATRDVVTVG